MHIVGIDIVDRPSARPNDLVPVSPAGLWEKLVATAGTEKAVSFATDEPHLRALYARIKTKARQAGYQLRYTTDRPHQRWHREKNAAFKVIMWVEAPEDTRPKAPAHDSPAQAGQSRTHSIP